MLRRIFNEKPGQRAEEKSAAPPAPAAPAKAEAKPASAKPADLEIKNPSGRLGEILVEEKIITPSQLAEGLEKQREEGGFLGQALIDLGHLDQDTLTLVLVKQCKIPHLSLLDYTISRDVIGLIPESLCRKHNVLPVDKMGKILTVAMVDPLNTNALEAVRAAFPELRIKPILCDWPHFNEVLEQVLPSESAPPEAMQVPPAAKPAAATPAEPAAPQPPTSAASERAPRTETPAPAQVEASTPAGMPFDAAAVQAAIREGMRESVAELERKLAEASHLLREVRETERAAVAAARDRDLGVTPAVRENGAGEPASGIVELGGQGRNATMTFENFIVGANNAGLVEMAKAVCAKPGAEHNPFFVCGDVGLGKTHLITAIGLALQSGGSGRRVGWTSAARFVDHAIAARDRHACESFRNAHDTWDVIVLDDVQFLAGRIEAQEEMFHVFNTLLEHGKQIVLAGDRAPDKLGLLEKRLVSRFDSGLVAFIQPPDWETRIRILRHYSAPLGVTAGDDVLAMIAMRHPDDVRRLIGSLRKVAAWAKTNGGKVTAAIASEILQEMGTEAAA